ncbi:hypothetical protein [Flavobacterium humidisoli]|jgi:hypothetical protein|uniref:Uncharacterized protein n=1 Tax=Flavobacterium humidisoli TaxID=2937442 RepID=A0ABY4LYW9_9FLAO|nr:hypothetical protein [Flavobacterium humidisoli]UPZ17987.1 hypothetical protein M0M44_11710 [Flavobacterium humidisoli]
MHYYYPLSSKDFTFENIFSSESISPPFFYKNRGFGIDYFYVIPIINHNNAIILFSNPPIYELTDNYKIILQIDENSLDLDNLIFLQEGVFAYQKTIYLDKSNFILNFFSEKDRRVSILKAATSLPTKNVEKFLNNFKVIDEESCISFDFKSELYNLETSSSKIILQEDKKFNQFKGLVYGITTGLYNYQPEGEKLFRRLLKEIVNSFAELKSRFADGNASYSKNKDKNKENDNYFYTKQLLDLIDLAKETYYNVYGELNFNEDVLAEILYEKLESVSSLEEAKQFIKFIKIRDEAFDTLEFQDLKKKFSNYSNYQQNESPINRLGILINQFVNKSINNTKNKYDLTELNDNIKILIYEIDQYAANSLRGNSHHENFSIDSLEYDFNKNEINIKNKFHGLSDNELFDMVSINNIILKFSDKNDKILRKDAILHIVKEVGDFFSKGNKETLLYQYLNNEIDTYAFEKITNSVMKNFVAFIFNIESLEKLENFIGKKNIEKDWMAYSFWGSFNGFANLSGNFTKTLFSTEGENVQLYLDQYLKKYVEILKNFKVDQTLRLPASKNEINNNEEYFSNSSISNFYVKVVFGNYDISKEGLIYLMSIKDKEEFCKEAKLKFKMGKKKAEKLFATVKQNFDSPLLFN